MSEPVEPDFSERTYGSGMMANYRWQKAAAKRMRALGATWMRFAWGDQPGEIIMDGWKVRPDVEAPVVWGDEDD